MHIQIRRAACALALALCLPGAVARAQQHFPNSDDLTDMLRFLVDDKATPGIVLAFSTRTVRRGS